MNDISINKREELNVEMGNDPIFNFKDYIATNKIGFELLKEILLKINLMQKDGDEKHNSSETLINLTYFAILYHYLLVNKLLTPTFIDHAQDGLIMCNFGKNQYPGSDEYFLRLLQVFTNYNLDGIKKVLNN